MTVRPGPPKKPAPRKPAAEKPAPTPASPSSPSRWRWLIPAGILIAFTALLLFHPGSGGTPAQTLGFLEKFGHEYISVAQ